MMKIRSQMRRLVAALLMPVLLAAALAMLPSSPAAAKGHKIRQTVCPVPWRKSPHQVRRLIRCAVDRWPVPGGAHYAIHIAKRESGLHAHAFNSGGYAGLFQQSVHYWSGRARRYGFPGTSPFDGRANTIVSIRMAHAGGWGPWAL
jgi:hypothetical protein